ncbi:uncharacterized protein LOC126995265 [Eriocheir sinensis]|uniref:uncharacterized protein LOC126995265 n=1 Tax=Eriocheir sinensis TaxID=95602 RepID=UPI0021CA336A|nr:uncharacterized protein LOC126995265 [Eriocheir sinensis]
MMDVGEEVRDSLFTSIADDTTVSRPTASGEDVSCLQQDLNAVYAWAATSNMQFKEEKFEVLRHGHNQDIKDTTKLHTEGGQEITPQPHVKCLGVHLDENCSFQHHIGETVRKAKMITGWVLRTFTSREPETMLILWKALVQPLLDYCSHLWSPHRRGDIQQLEAVQRSFTRQIQGMGGFSYWERL